MKEKFSRRNYLLGVLNGIFIRTSFSALHGSTILPAFVSNLTPSNVLIGLSVAISRFGEVLPQIVVANLVEHQPRKKPLYVTMIWIRLLTLAVLASVVYRLTADQKELILVLFFVLFSIHILAGGIASIPFTDIVGKITTSRRRGSFFSERYFFGGLLAALAGVVVVRPVLARYPFPRNYGILFFFSLIFLALALFVFSLIKEPIHPVRKSRRRFGHYLRDGLTILKKDRNFLLLILIMFTQGLCGMAAPFYIIFARKVLGHPEAMVGYFLAASMAGAVISSLGWRKLSLTGGSLILIRASTALAIARPVIALASAGLKLTNPVFFMVLFFLGGAAMSGHGVGHQSYLLDIAPGVERPAYVAFMSTLGVPLMFFPALGGVVINLSSFGFLFGLALFFAVIALLLTFKLGK